MLHNKVQKGPLFKQACMFWPLIVILKNRFQLKKQLFWVFFFFFFFCITLVAHVYNTSFQMAQAL